MNSINNELNFIDVINLMDFMLQLHTNNVSDANNAEIHQRLCNIETKLDMIIERLGDDYGKH